MTETSPAVTVTIPCSVLDVLSDAVACERQALRNQLQDHLEGSAAREAILALMYDCKVALHALNHAEPNP